MKGSAAVSANAVDASLGYAAHYLVTAAASATVIALTRPISQVIAALASGVPLALGGCRTHLGCANLDILIIGLASQHDCGDFSGHCCSGDVRGIEANMFSALDCWIAASIGWFLQEECILHPSIQPRHTVHCLQPHLHQNLCEAHTLQCM